jgi:basic membrane protein A
VPYFGSLKDGIVNIAPLSNSIRRDPKIIQILDEERRRIETGEFDVFTGLMETNDGRRIGRDGETLPDQTIRNGIDWHYRNVVVVK